MPRVRLTFVRRLHRYLDPGRPAGRPPLAVREADVNTMGDRLSIAGKLSRARALAPPDGDPLAELDGDSPPMRVLKDRTLRAGRDGDVTVLVLGESGTGKERVARAVHRLSPRHRAPFVVVNCAGLTPTLVEDELFGHVRGAFTGAIDEQAGPFERAGGGTVFLDEVGDLTADLQMKLLRALQQRTVQRLGGRHETPFDARIVAATHVDLASAVADGRFREDLYYRLKVYELRVPALRERGASDLRLLVSAVSAQLAGRRGREAIVVDPRVCDLFARYAWPGNVRELESTLESMLVDAGGGQVLTLEHLPDGFGSASPARARQLSADVSARSRTALPSGAEVADALERHGGHRGRAAAALGVSRHQLYRLVRRDGLGSRAPVE